MTAVHPSIGQGYCLTEDALARPRFTAACRCCGKWVGQSVLGAASSSWAGLRPRGLTASYVLVALVHLLGQTRQEMVVGGVCPWLGASSSDVLMDPCSSALSGRNSDID
jgi:hypothetical protein